MNIKPDKPFKTYKEQILHLQKIHDLKIIDPIWAENALKFIPYYDLINGYKDIFMENDKFKTQITFEYIYLFHEFDRQLQNLIFPFSKLIEDYFKNNLAYVLSKNFGVFESDYLSYKNYVARKGKITFKTTYNQIIKLYTYENGKRKSCNLIEEPTSHYIKNHNHIPPWILLKNTSFSNAINLFILLKQQQKNELANMLININIPIDQKIQLLIYTLTLIRTCRNTIAHNLKFISFNSDKYSKALSYKTLKSFIPNELLNWKDIHNNVGISDVYAYICFSLAILPNSLEKINSTKNLLYFFDNFQNESNLLRKTVLKTYCDKTHLPISIRDRLRKYIISSAKNTPIPTI